MFNPLDSQNLTPEPSEKTGPGAEPQKLKFPKPDGEGYILASLPNHAPQIPEESALNSADEGRRAPRYMPRTLFDS